MLIAHRVNTIDYFYGLYFAGFRAFELDVQLHDGKIVVEHDEISEGSKGSQLLRLTLEEYLKVTPDDILLNVEIKIYSRASGVSKRVLDICKKFPGKNYVFSSFDTDVYRFFADRKMAAWLLQESVSNKLDVRAVNAVCVHKSMLPQMKAMRSAPPIVGVYDVKQSRVKSMAATYPFVKFWIVDGAKRI